MSVENALEEVCSKTSSDCRKISVEEATSHLIKIKSNSSAGESVPEIVESMCSPAITYGINKHNHESTESETPSSNNIHTPGNHPFTKIHHESPIRMNPTESSFVEISGVPDIEHTIDHCQSIPFQSISELNIQNVFDPVSSRYDANYSATTETHHTSTYDSSHDAQFPYEDTRRYEIYSNNTPVIDSSTSFHNEAHSTYAESYVPQSDYCPSINYAPSQVADYLPHQYPRSNVQTIPPSPPPLNVNISTNQPISLISPDIFPPIGICKSGTYSIRVVSPRHDMNGFNSNIPFLFVSPGGAFSPSSETTYICNSPHYNMNNHNVSIRQYPAHRSSTSSSHQNSQYNYDQDRNYYAPNFNWTPVQDSAQMGSYDEKPAMYGCRDDNYSSESRYPIYGSNIRPKPPYSPSPSFAKFNKPSEYSITKPKRTTKRTVKTCSRVTHGNETRESEDRAACVISVDASDGLSPIQITSKRSAVDYCIHKLTHIYGDKVDNAGFRGDTSTRFRVKTWKALRHCVPFLLRVKEEIIVTKACFPESTKRAKRIVRGLLAYIQVENEEEVKKLQALFQKYQENNNYPFKKLELTNGLKKSSSEQNEPHENTEDFE